MEQMTGTHLHLPPGHLRSHCSCIINISKNIVFMVISYTWTQREPDEHAEHRMPRSHDPPDSLDLDLVHRWPGSLRVSNSLNKALKKKKQKLKHRYVNWLILINNPCVIKTWSTDWSTADPLISFSSTMAARVSAQAVVPGCYGNW